MKINLLLILILTTCPFVLEGSQAQQKEKAGLMSQLPVIHEHEETEEAEERLVLTEKILRAQREVNAIRYATYISPLNIEFKKQLITKEKEFEKLRGEQQNINRLALAHEYKKWFATNEQVVADYNNNFSLAKEALQQLDVFLHDPYLTDTQRVEFENIARYIANMVYLKKSWFHYLDFSTFGKLVDDLRNI